MRNTEPDGAWRLPQPIRTARVDTWLSLRDLFAGVHVRCVPAPGGFPAILLSRTDTRHSA